jgi:hypothetical protein
METSKMDTTQLETVDPYLDHYIYEKTADPTANIVWKQFQKHLVDRTNRIVELARGNRDVIKSSSDWTVLEELVKFWGEEFPQEYQEFKASIPDIRSSRNAGGYSKTKEIKYLGALPPRLIKMIRVIFPFQQFDKAFMYKLIRKFPLFKVGGVNNLSKGSVII